MNDSPDQQKAISAEKIPVLDSSAPVKPVDSAKSGVEDRQVFQRHIAILEMALESCGHGMMITDDQGVIVFHNQNLLRLLGMTGTLVKGTGWQEAFIRRAKNEAHFSTSVAQIMQKRTGETLDIFEWADGRLLECATRYQYIDSLAAGFRLWSFTDCTEQQRRERELTHLGTHDTLTGIYNRAYFDIHLRQMCLGECYPVCMFMIDLDGLKRVNDCSGHSAGDSILRRVASLLGQACRADDIVARLGGDEFGLLLAKADTDTAEQITGRIQGLLNLYNIRHPEEQISLSMGFAIAHDHSEIEDLFARADKTMYESRRKRRETLK